MKPGFEDRPVNYVAFYDTLRYCNWLHNGAVTGGDTETGAYTLLGGTVVPANGVTVPRNPGARFVVPTEDEWYKAAYYDPGAGPGDNYWMYPTQSDSATIAEAPPGGANSANMAFVLSAVTDGGAYVDTFSYYGAYDMGGNLAETCDVAVRTSGVIHRGGGFNSAVSFAAASNRVVYGNLASQFFSFGFRVACP